MRAKLQIPPEIMPRLRSAVIAKWATEYLRDRNVRRYGYENRGAAAGPARMAMPR